MAAPTHMTVQEYYQTPVTLTPMELIYGKFRVAESPSVRHQSAVARLFLALHRHVVEHALGQMWLSPLDVVLDEKRALIMQPDLFFISNERRWIVQDRIRGAPDLVIEVLSPKPRIGSTDERMRLFAEHNVRECWLVHQDRREISVIQYRARRLGERQTFGAHDPVLSAVLPRFQETWDTLLGSEMT